MTSRKWKSASCCSAILVALIFSGVKTLAADDSKIKLEESYTKDQFFEAQARVVTSGKVITTKTKDEEKSLPIQASASFRFIDRLLPPAGRDAYAFRAVRYFTLAQLETTVENHTTTSKLEDNSRFIVSSGRREGVLNYSPQSRLNSDALDLLDLPGDPLAILALLPVEAKEVGAEWSPADWAIQMLVGIDAADESKMTCKLNAANKLSAKITLKGNVKGNHLGAPATVDVTGTIIFDRRTQHVSRAQVVYHIQSDVGTIDPGSDLTVTSDFARTLLEEQDKITPAMIEAIPFDPPEEQLQVTFSVPDWGLQLHHHRDWHLISTLVDSSQPVAILRLNEFGSLVAQCNLTPLLKAAVGTTVPLEQFEDDIKTSLGERFTEFGKREEVPTDDGRTIFRVEAIGQTQFGGKDDKFIEIPMIWIYYLVTHPDGRQASFVFALERPLLEQFGEKDVELVKSIKFTTPLRTTNR